MVGSSGRSQHTQELTEQPQLHCNDYIRIQVRASGTSTPCKPPAAPEQPVQDGGRALKITVPVPATHPLDLFRKVFES